MKELGIDNSLGNPTYTPMTLTEEEILDNHRSVLCYSWMKNRIFPSYYWIPKVHKCPYKQLFPNYYLEL